MEKKLITENELCRIYTNSASKSLTEYCESYFNDYKPLKDHKVFVCEEKKDGHKIYVLFNDKGEPIEEDYAFDGMAVKIEMLRFLKGENK